jgi:hypothetical protein
MATRRRRGASRRRKSRRGVQNILKTFKNYNKGVVPKPINTGYRAPVTRWAECVSGQRNERGACVGNTRNPPNIWKQSSTK